MSVVRGAALVIGGWILVQSGSKAVKEVHWLTMRPDDRAVDILARTLWGEARNQGNDGMAAVANVVINRVASGRTWWGYDIPSVCLADWQFSCWNITDPNRPLMLAVGEYDQQFAAALEIARAAVAGNLADNTNGATHYHALGVRPAWASTGQVSAVIGAHKFYTGVA